VHLVLLAIAMEGSSTLGQLLTLVGQELLLVVQTVRDIAIVAPFVLDNTIKEVLVLGLGCPSLELISE